MQHSMHHCITVWGFRLQWTASMLVTMQGELLLAFRNIVPCGAEDGQNIIPYPWQAAEGSA